MASIPVTKVTEEYLRLDRAAEVRSEFLDGEMWAMPGGSSWLSQIATNLTGELVAVLRGGKCRAFNSDLRVRVMPGRMYAYPDATVVCGEPRFTGDSQDILINPTAIFEVLSPGTESYDRGAKFRNYPTIETLKDYLLLDQSAMHVERYTRAADGTWTFRAYDKPEDQLKIESIGASISRARVYDGVELAPPGD